MNTPVQSKGEYRVGIGFNPSGDDLVALLKRQAAELIDTISAIEAASGAEIMIGTHDAEVARCKALAETAIEEGAMWAVKAATKRAPTPAAAEAEQFAAVSQDEAA